MPLDYPVADITKLSRLTSGEISPDQAVIDYFYNDPAVWIGWMAIQGFFDQLSQKFSVGSRIRLRGLVSNPDQFPNDRVATVTYKVTGLEAIPYKPYQKVTVLSEDEAYTYSTADAPNLFWEHYACVYKYRGLVRYQSKAQSPISGNDYFEFSPPQLAIHLSAGDICIVHLIALSGFTVSPWTVFQARCETPDRVHIRWAPYPEVTPGPPGPPEGTTVNVWCEIMNRVPQYFP